MMIKEIRERDPTPPSLLIAAHCLTIRRKAKRFDIKEFSAILDDIVRELNNPTIHLKTYFNSLNEIVKILNSTLPPILLKINSHYFFILIRNTIRNLLLKLSISKQLNDQEIYLLRNCVLLIHYLVKHITDVSKLLHWITDGTFLDALATCLNRINKISKKDQNKQGIKQITRLLDMFCTIQKRLPLDLHQTLFVRLLQPTINRLISSKYIKLFQNLKSTADSFTEIQKLFLIKCPYFLTTYNGPHIEKAIEQVLKLMLPRCVSILDEHIKTIKEWKRPIMRGIHNLIITIVYAEGYFSLYTNTESFRSLINHLLTILNEPTLINKIHANSNNIETLLIDATLVAFNVLVNESNGLDYIKQCKSTDIFRQLTKISNENIVLNAYMMLAYTMDDHDIKTSQENLTQLLSIIVNLLRKTIETRQQMNSDQNIDRNILQLLQTLKGLVQYEQIRNEILKQGILPFLIDSYGKLYGLSRQILLECFWKLSFNEQITQQLREHQQFILLLENIPKPVNHNILQDAIRRSNSYSGRRNSASIVLGEATNGIQKVADGLLWKIVKEPQFQEKIIKKMKNENGTNVLNDHQKYKYDIMISHCIADKEIVYKIQRFLANEGYNIWFDRKHNHGQAMEIVAEAIENSEFVIICMSDSYKRDNHCQTQAEYALVSKRILIPLIVHSDYKPDGWLSSIISNNNIYIDFGASNFKVASALLLKEIKQRQPKKKILDIKPKISTSANIVHNSSANLTVSNKPYIPVESSPSSESNSSAVSSFPSTIVNNQQQTSTSSTPWPPTPISIYTVAPVIVVKQQVPIKSIFTSSIPDSISSGASMVVNKQQQSTASTHPISRSSTSRTTPSITSTTVIQEPQILVHSVSRSPTANSIFSAASVIIDKQQHQMSEHPVTRSSTPSSISSDSSVSTGKQRQQTSVYPVSEPLIPGTSAPVTSTVIDKQQQQTSIPPVSRSSTPGSTVSTALTVVDKQPPQESVHSILKSPTSSTISSDASVNIEKKQQQQPTDSVTQPPATNAVPSVASAAVVQQQSVHPVSQTSTTNAVFPATSVDIEKQQQRIPSRSNSRPRTPAGLPVASSINSVLLTSSQANGQEQPHLPKEYTNRKTHNSIYRTISIDAWRNNDVLDFLFDTNLYAMMPLCESMTGKGLLRLVRMCQRKPSRLYDQLNEELRVRFKGFPLSIGVYTQFLIEMDALVGHEPDAPPSIPDPAPKVVERVIFMPHTIQQQEQQHVAIQTSPRSSIHSARSSNQSEAVTPVETISETTTPQSTRIVERGVYRPASNIGRPYDFIIESFEEPTVLIDQVQRYGNELLFFDTTALQHRKINNYY